MSEDKNGDDISVGDVENTKALAVGRGAKVEYSEHHHYHGDEARSKIKTPSYHDILEPRSENLFSNLLQVTKLPDRIFIGQTDIKHARIMYATLRDLAESIEHEWVLKYGGLISFHELDKFPWSEVCDIGTVEEFDVTEWSQTEEQERRNDFVQLLNQSLRAKCHSIRLRYSSKKECFYFPATKTLKKRKIDYQQINSMANRTVFAGYRNKKDSSKIAYYRHSAFQGQFHRFDGIWYLEITPTYLFTNDGRNLSRFDSDLTSGIKRREHHKDASAQTLMWAYLLSQPSNMFEQEYPFLKFGELATFEIDKGINDKQWKKTEAEQKGLGPLFE